MNSIRHRVRGGVALMLLVLSFSGKTVASSNSADTAMIVPDVASGGTTESRGLVQVGVGIGTPASINLIAGIGIGPVALKLSGGSWGSDWHGWQAGLTLNLTRQGWLEQGVAIIVGNYTLKPLLTSSDGSGSAQSTSDRYLGLAYDAMIGGVAIQVGLALQDHQREHTLLAVQIGYLLTLL